MNRPIESPNPIALAPNRRRLRILVDGVVIADSVRSIYLFEPGHSPVFYVPLADVSMQLLQPTEHSTHCPRKGDARYWSISVGDRTVENAMWNYPTPLPGAPNLSAYGAFYWDRVDQWFEDEQELVQPPRDVPTQHS